METYEKREGTSSILGQWYEIKLIMFTFIQTIIAGFKFKLANNMKLAGDFDDVVINIQFDELQSKTVFIQAKHVENPTKKKITISELQGQSGNFSLFKYFKSYQQIIKSKSELIDKGLDVDDAEFVIYTNTDFKDPCNGFFKAIEASDIIRILASKDVSAYKIKVEKFDCIFSCFKTCAKNEADAEMNKAILKNIRYERKELEFTKEGVYEYLRKLTILIKQGNECEVEDKIKKCISVKFDEHNQEEVNDNYSKSYNEYQAWWKSQGEVKFLTQDDNYFQKYFSQMLLNNLNRLTLNLRIEVTSKCIEFADLKIFAKEIHEAGSVEILTIPGARMLTVAKVLQLHEGQHDIMFVDSECVKQFSDKIKYNFSHCKTINTLVYYKNDEKPETAQFVKNMLNIVKIDCNKRFIVICDERIGCEKTVPIVEIKFCDLSAKAQKFVENRKLKFQDKEMCVKDVIDNCEILSDELLAQVLLKELVQIGNGQIENLEKLHYIPRKFKKHHVDHYIIDKCKDDVLLIQASENDCRHKFCIGREVRFYPETDPNRKNVYYILPSNYKLTVFQELFEKSKNVHLLEYYNKQLRWLKSHGSMKLIMENLKVHNVLTESEIVNCCNKDQLVVISDVAGIGKTTVLKSLANIVNEQYPGLWILKINLLQHTKVLHSIKEAKAKQNVCETILNSLSYSSENEKSFLSKMFAAGRVAVFLDGFDEISPDYEKIVINLVKELQFINVQNIYLTTRPSMRECISENLHALSYTFVALDTEEQANFVSSEWLRKEGHIDQEKKKLIKDLAKQLIAKMSSISSEQDIAICGIPSQLRMIVDIYPTFNEVKTILENSKILITLECLYKNFLEKKVHVYCVEKIELIPNSARFESAFKRTLMYTLHEHQLIAIDMIFSDNIKDILLSKITKKIYKQPHDITSYGIVSKALSKHSEFTHRTFAEYLSALYLCSKLEEKKCEQITKMFLTEILVGRNYQVLRKFLNSMIEKYENISRPLLIVEHYTKEQDSLDFKTPLHFAAIEKNMKILKFLLIDLVPESESAKQILNSYNGMYTVLQIIVKLSVSSEYLDVIDLLVSLGADVYLRTKDGKSILYLSGNNINVLERLVRVAEEKSQLQKLLGNDALLGAVRSSNLECVKLLISYEASVNWKDNGYSTLLHLASRTGSLEIVKCLVKHGANVNDKDNNGRSVLYVAASNGHLDIVKWLVEHGANVNDKHIDGRSILEKAVSNGHLYIVKCLVKHGANVNDKENFGWSVLHVAASDGHLDIVKCLVEHGANVNAKDNDGSSVLYVFAINGHLEIVNYLVEHGANVNDKDNYGLSVLYVAARNGHLDIVKCLVEHGANVNDKDNNGWSVLYVAGSFVHLDTVKCLVEHGANVNDKKNDGKSVLHVAARHVHLDMVKCLVEHGANVNDKDNDGSSVLHVAASNDDLDIVKCLVEHGANVNDKDNNGSSVLHVAAYNGDLDIVKYLVENGANVNDKDNNGWSVLYVTYDSEVQEYLFAMYQQIT